MEKIDISRLVQFKEPTESEKGLVYKITNYNEVTGRCYIQPVNLEGWGDSLIPQQLVLLSDLENVAE